MTPTVTSIHIYPVKGLRGLELEKTVVEPRGLRNDRRWMVTDPDFRFLTQRELPRLALIQPRLIDRGIALSTPGMEVIEVEIPTSLRVPVRVWRDEVHALKAGGQADEWLSRYLERPSRLVYMDESARRPVDPNYGREGDLVSFADGFPLLLASTSSLVELNTRLESPLPMNRFRPNLVVSGYKAFEEDHWTAIRVGEVVFDVVKPCARCAVTTVDQATAEQGLEPLRTLATFRRRNGKVYFGQNLIPRTTGTVRSGDRVEVLSVS